MNTISCPAFYIDQVLRKAGYEKHHKDLGYVRDIDAFTRWHAFPVRNRIEIHLDKTSKKNKHYVTRSIHEERMEFSRIESAISSIVPPKPPKPKKETAKVEYAPNLLELQRNKKAKIIKKNYWARFLDFIINKNKL